MTSMIILFSMCVAIPSTIAITSPAFATTIIIMLVVGRLKLQEGYHKPQGSESPDFGCICVRMHRDVLRCLAGFGFSTNPAMQAVCCKYRKWEQH